MKIILVFQRMLIISTAKAFMKVIAGKQGGRYIKGSVKKALTGFSFTHLRIKNYAS